MGKRQVWTVIQRRAPGEKTARIGGASVLKQTTDRREAEELQASVASQGGEAYLVVREQEV